jgi:hypothetical protein
MSQLRKWMPVSARDETSDTKAFEQLVHLSSMHDQTNILLDNLETHNL